MNGLRELEWLVNQLPDISALEGVVIQDSVARTVYDTGDTILKKAVSISGMCEIALELQLWLLAPLTVKKFLCPVIGANIVRNYLILEMEKAITPVTDEEVESSQLLSFLVEKDSDCLFCRDGIVISDLGPSSNGIWHNLGLLHNGELIIVDYAFADWDDCPNKHWIPDERFRTLIENTEKYLELFC